MMVNVIQQNEWEVTAQYKKIYCEFFSNTAENCAMAPSISIVS